MIRPLALKKFQLKKYLPHSNHCSRNGINWVLSDENRRKELCVKAREKAVACFDIKKKKMNIEHPTSNEKMKKDLTQRSEGTEREELKAGSVEAEMGFV